MPAHKVHRIVAEQISQAGDLEVVFPLGAQRFDGRKRKHLFLSPVCISSQEPDVAINSFIASECGRSDHIEPTVGQSFHVPVDGIRREIIDGPAKLLPQGVRFYQLPGFVVKLLYGDILLGTYNKPPKKQASDGACCVFTEY